MKKLLILALFLASASAFASPVATFNNNNISHSIILNYAGYGVYGYNRFNYGLLNLNSERYHEPNVISVKLRDHFGFDEHVVINDGAQIFGLEHAGYPHDSYEKLGYGHDGFNKFGVNNIVGDRKEKHHK